MKLGRYAVWCSLEGVPLAEAIDAARRIESLGYSALWQPMGMRRDLMVTASLQLAATQSLVIATGIATIYERAPIAMAAAQRALGEQSGGRFLLGLGCSHGPITQPIFGRAYEPPLQAMRDFLDRMDAGIAPIDTGLSCDPRNQTLTWSVRNTLPDDGNWIAGHGDVFVLHAESGELLEVLGWGSSPVGN